MLCVSIGKSLVPFRSRMATISSKRIQAVARAAIAEFFFRKKPENIITIPNNAEIMIEFIFCWVGSLGFEVHFSQQFGHRFGGKFKKRCRVNADAHDQYHDKSEREFFGRL